MIKFFERNHNNSYCEYIGKKDCHGLKKSNFPVCFFKIVSLFADDCHNQITQLYTMNNNLWIGGSYKGIENELMLRFKYNDDNIGLVIARIQFINQKKGNFSKLIKILEDIRKQYGLGEVMIECANTLEINNWIKKNKWTEYRWKGNYISEEASNRILSKKHE